MTMRVVERLAVLAGGLLVAVIMLYAQSSQAAVVSLNLDNNGTVITDGAQIIDVDYQNLGGNMWQVTVDDGLNFEGFFANFSGNIASVNIVSTAPGATTDWSQVTTGQHSAGNFGKFSFELDGPAAPGSSSLVFTFTAAGIFEPNKAGNIFAAKISSQAGGNAGGFVSHGAIAVVPLPAAIWLFLTALGGLALTGRRRAGRIV